MLKNNAKHSPVLLSDLSSAWACLCRCCFIHCLQRELKARNETSEKCQIQIEVIYMRNKPDDDEIFSIYASEQ